MITLVFGSRSSVGKCLKEIMPETLSRQDSVLYLDSHDCNLLNLEEVYAIIKNYQPHNVIMLAAKVGGIFDNVNKPYDYLMQNTIMNTNVIDSCRELGVQRLLCLSSTCAYPDILDESQYPLTEKNIHDGPPTITNFGYGYAKRLMQTQIEMCNKQFGTQYSYLIPCNLYGPYSSYDSHSHFLGKLLRKIWEHENNPTSAIEMAGGSSAYRQYLYTPDLAECIKRWVQDPNHEPLLANIAPTENLPICLITEIALKVCKCDANVLFLDESMSGQRRKDVSSKLLLSRYPDFQFTSLRDGIKQTYEKVKLKW